MFKQFISLLNNTLFYLFRWLLLVMPVAVIIGGVVAFFLWLLNLAIHYRFAHPWLLYLLPAAGVVIHLLYKLWGKSAERGNNLVIEEMHEPGAGIPKRMAPLILFTTVITHLFGGSAGREGTAVQIGGSIAHYFADLFKLTTAERKVLLMAGVAAGFGAVFGTPITGAIFALEVIIIGKINYSALLPCLIAGFVADATVAACGIHHTAYHIAITNTDVIYYGHHFPFDLLLILKVIFASALFGLVSMFFAEATHTIKRLAGKLFKKEWLIPVCGGLFIIALTLLIGKSDYLSLGVDAEYPGAVTIVSAFQHGGAHALSWLWKLVYTAITLGTGFKGGEVTPLFFIGSTLGNTLAEVLSAPVSLFAALGFIAVFAGATNTPIACTLMGIELFGAEHALLFAIACTVAYLFSGDNGIYTTQQKEDVKGARSYWRRRINKY